MSIKTLPLRKFLQIVYARPNVRISLLRADIRRHIKKDLGLSGEGGDFYGPFWSDAKDHVAGKSDLGLKTKVRIQSNKGRERLYPELEAGFLAWWNEKRRWKNENFEFIEQRLSARVQIANLGVITVENVLALKIGDQSNRLIYPYFSEEPTLTSEGARLGLWLMQRAFSGYPLGDLRILDVLRAKTFAATDHPLVGNEGQLFESKYHSALEEWDKLRSEYD